MFVAALSSGAPRMHDDLKIICWPDPRLLKRSAPVETFDAALTALARRMLDLMREARGVGLAAPQVGVNVRLFVMNHSGQPADERVYVNPVLSDPSGEEEGEEGCLSLPGITARILRSSSIRMSAHDLSGNPIAETASGYVARIWQHEVDHLNGILLMDRMSPVARLTHRKALRELKARYLQDNPAPRGRRLALR